MNDQIGINRKVNQRPALELEDRLARIAVGLVLVNGVVRTVWPVRWFFSSSVTTGMPFKLRVTSSDFSDCG